MSTFHPEFSSVFFTETAPGENWDKLRKEMEKTVTFYEYRCARVFVCVSVCCAVLLV